MSQRQQQFRSYCVRRPSPPSVFFIEKKTPCTNAGNGYGNCGTALTIAIDTGGTFTDCVYRVAGRLEVLKLPSTPDDPGRAIFNAIEQIAERTRAKAIEIRHGTTVATNALLERKGAQVAFVTTAGFEDTLAIARQARPSLSAMRRSERASRSRPWAMRTNARE